MNRNIFIIGPASVGKSTTAKLLADKLGYTFIDIDLVFCDEIEIITDYINNYGYVAYCERNSELVDELILRYPERTVFATPSGFLVHEDSPELVAKHIRLVSDQAISVLLLPSLDPNEHTDMIVDRQLKRYPDLSPEKEAEKYRSRHKKYKQYGDIQIIGAFSPEEIVKNITGELKEHGELLAK